MKFSVLFLIYSCILGLLVGIVAAIFLLVTNFFIDVVWQKIPAMVNIPLYPLFIGLLGGALVGLIQKNIGSYPTTIEETLSEFKRSNRVSYKGSIGKNCLSATVVLMFGASLGPEAALAGIVGGLITWMGDHLKWTFERKEELLKLSIGAMLAAIFRTPLAGISGVFDHNQSFDVTNKLKKIVLYTVSALFGLIGFLVIEHFSPEESVFSIHFSNTVQWEWQAILVSPLGWGIGGLFGLIFLKLEKLTNQLAKKIDDPMVKTMIAGAFLGIFGIWSPYFLFSGEHQLLPFSKEALQLTFFPLLLLGIGKAFLSNFCFSFGWRGGKIFPAIFSSTAIGFAFVSLFPYTPGLVIGVIVAASLTIILEQPYLSIGLLLFLFPIQFIPAILISSLGIHTVKKYVQKKFLLNR
ncbi:chloride channel protein [Enterococcus villorum]|uniref:Chloride channel protein n=1 Tax=Enterococcus villorum TaxID=112904 RepID=A0A1V8YNV9_9ENTE|nr:chloride channel protein [Enterococcus villorum]OQO70558.1 chloride channel protein [Enterococcus villorum]OQO74274.1 chloride channel protein [Enterococcus villorum]